MNGFGLTYLRQEGGAIHPDDVMGCGDADLAQYRSELKAYILCNGYNSDEYCSHPEVLAEILEELK